jgi:hypothetical protein
MEPRPRVFRKQVENSAVKLARLARATSETPQQRMPKITASTAQIRNDRPRLRAHAPMTTTNNNHHTTIGTTSALYPFKIVF